MDQPIRIGVTGNARRWSPSWWAIQCVLRLCGARPQRISTLHSAEYGDFDGLVISGGDDISPEHYGGDMEAPVKSDPARDDLEIRWIRHALDRGIPLLGICRGAQLINVVLGGSLHTDIRPMRKLTYNRPGLLPTKQVRLDTDSLVGKVTGRERLRVNSLHHQAIDRLGDGLRITGRDLDGFVQVIESKHGSSIVGVQWHPEYLLYLPAQFALFHWFVKATGTPT